MSINRVLSFLAIAVLAVAACTSSAGGASSASGGTSNTSAVVIGSESSPSFGMVLTGPNGMALYTHAGDSATASSCTGACATAWPPLETKGQPTAKAGITGQLGTLTRADGATQVTYAGMPLYYWQGDTKAGDTTGNGVEGFSIATVGGSAPAAPAAKPSVAAPAPSAPSAPSSGGKYGY